MDINSYVTALGAGQTMELRSLHVFAPGGVVHGYTGEAGLAAMMFPVGWTVTDVTVAKSQAASSSFSPRLNRPRSCASVFLCDSANRLTSSPPCA